MTMNKVFSRVLVVVGIALFFPGAATPVFAAGSHGTGHGTAGHGSGHGMGGHGDGADIGRPATPSTCPGRSRLS